MWSAACSTTEKEYEIRMKEIKGLHVGAWEWFQDKPPTQWSKAFFNVNTKCDMLLNNVCESFNFAIQASRDKAIITMLEWIREYLVKRLQKHRDRAASKWMSKKICPRIEKVLQKNIDKIAYCIPVKSDNYHYEIRCFDGKQFTVDLKEKECTCRAWQLCGIPCTHAACAILAQKLDPIDFVQSYYSVDAYVKAYENPIMGISYEMLWDETFFIPPTPPNFGKPKRGRKATARRKEEDKGAAKGKNKRKMRRQGGKIKCRICGIEGHNAATCGKKKQKEFNRGLVDEEIEEEQLYMNMGEGSSREPMVISYIYNKAFKNC